MARSNFFLLITFLVLVASKINAQHHFVYLKDKNNSTYSLQKPEEFLSSKSILRRQKQGITLSLRDLPISTAYIAEIKSLGAKILYKSRWMNAVLLDADQATLDKIKNLSYVKTNISSYARISNNPSSLRTGGITKTKKEQAVSYGVSIDQNHLLGIDVMHQDGKHGEGMTIAVLDAGFYNANSLPVFDTLFKNNQILATYDFVNHETSVYEDNIHGTQVLSALGGYLEGSLIGGAYKSKYILLKTEDISKESKLEEIYWLLGAEYADSAGVDILSSSLGYNTFDNSSDNYTKDQLDGNTAIITKAADFAASTGILVVVSAGNEGDNSWGKITFPADADSVLSVGAVDKLNNHASFSSRGNTTDNRIKPDVVGMGAGSIVANGSGGISSSSGTSFSAPMVAGLAAGIWQTFPNLTNMEVLEVIKRSGSKNDNPDSLKGHGIPNYATAKILLTNGIEDEIEGDIIIFPNPLGDSDLIIQDNEITKTPNVRVSIYNSNSKLIYSDTTLPVEDKITLDKKSLNHLPTGTYILKIKLESRIISKKIIKL